MSKKQSEKIKNLKKQIKDFNDRLEFECFDCGGRQRHGPRWDCEIPNCGFYEIRPKAVYYKKPIPRKFGQNLELEADRKPVKKLTKK